MSDDENEKVLDTDLQKCLQYLDQLIGKDYANLQVQEHDGGQHVKITATCRTCFAEVFGMQKIGVPGFGRFIVQMLLDGAYTHQQKHEAPKLIVPNSQKRGS